MPDIVCTPGRHGFSGTCSTNKRSTNANTFAYDVGGRLTLQTAPDPDDAGSQLPASQHFSYDSLGNVISSRHDLSTGTRQTYDSRFRVTSSTDSSGATTQFSYDVFGQLLSLTDAKSNVTSYAYDRLGRSYQETKVGYGSRTSRLDGAGNVRSTEDRNGRVTEYDYDFLGRVTTESWLGTDDTLVRQLQYSYDASSNLLQAMDEWVEPSTGQRTSASDSLTFTYNALGQVASTAIQSSLSGMPDVQLTGGYDSRGLRLLLNTKIDGVNDLTNSYQYNALGLMTQVVQSGTDVAYKKVDFGYNAAAQLTTMSRWGTTSSLPLFVAKSYYAYDGAGRLASIVHSTESVSTNVTWDGSSASPTGVPSASVLAAYNLQHDQANRIGALSSYFDGFKTSYTYDTRDQLTGATSTQIAGLTLPFALPSLESYSFDATGNREIAGESISEDGMHNRVTSDGTYSYVYDNEGNQISRTRLSDGQVTTYQYDQRNRLERVIQPGITVTYLYDTMDRRVGKHVDTDNNGTIDRSTTWVWDDYQVLFQFENADGDGPDSFELAHRYLWGPGIDMLLADEPVSDDPFSMSQPVEPELPTPLILWVLPDHLGSVRDLIDSTGSRREHNIYDSFGVLLVEQDYSGGTPISSNSPAAVNIDYGFTSRQWDADIGLQYTIYRWYDPLSGRWINEDPIGFAGGDVNLNRYVGNGPTNATDPYGLFQLPVHIRLTVTGVNDLGLPNDVVRGLVRGVVHPDIQYMPLNAQGIPAEKIVEAQYWVTNVMQPWTDFKNGVGEMSWGASKSVGRYLAPSLYDELRLLRNWWQDSSMLPGAVDAIDQLLTSGGMDEYSPKNLGIYETHYGELSWLHAMLSGSSQETAQEFQNRLAQYIAGQIDKYRRLSDAGKGFEAGFELGKALHMVQDSHSPSHTVRNSQGIIQRFQYYGAQSPTLHGNADNIQQNDPLFLHVHGMTSNFVRLANDRSLRGADLLNRIKSQFFQISEDCEVGGVGIGFEPRR